MTDEDINATVIADGAFLKERQRGAWGAWMCRRGGLHTAIGGPIEGTISASHEAEIRAITSALREAISRDIVREGDTVLLETDCTSVIAGALVLVDGAVQSPAPGGLEVQRPKGLSPAMRTSVGLGHMQTLADTWKLSLRLRHRQRDSGWVSRRIDEIARRQLTAVLRR